MTGQTVTGSAIMSRRDLQFLLHEWLDVGELCTRPRYAAHTCEIFDDVLELAEHLATERFAPHNRLADVEEPFIDDGAVVVPAQLETALLAFNEAGLTGAGMDEAVGGMQLPSVITNAVLAWFQAANVSTTAYPVLTIAAANMLSACGSPAQVGRWVPPMVEGRFYGTMCLSETQAGSSLADVSTRAEPHEDGTYRVHGTKMWISGGEHELSENIVHLVLARIPGQPAGLRGVSLFIVPRFLVDDDGSIGERNDVTLAGLNHKMGYRGTVNTVLAFGEGSHLPSGRAGAVAYLVGEPNRGLSYMFHMMNEARVAVGLGATCLGYTAYLKALRYARERPQGRPPGQKDPASAQVPLMAHTDVKRMLLAQKSYVEGALALVLYCGRLVDEQRTAADPDARALAELLLDVLTPIAKSWPSQWCLAANDLAIQVHGGYGYAREYDVEQHYRDNRLNPIHEGTHGIQGLDLLGRKVVMQDGRGLTVLVETIEATISRATMLGGEASLFATQLAARVGRLVEVTARLWSAGDPAETLANATIYLEAAGHVVVAWIWLEQFLVADSQVGDFYEGKRQACRFYFTYELPRVDPQFDLLATRDRTALDMQDAWF